MADRLKKFEGREVRGVKITFTTPGDALNRTMEIEPETHQTGDTVRVVLECKVGKITHDPIKDTDAYNRVEEYRVALATIVDADLVKEVLDRQRDTIRLADEEKKGIGSLSFGGDDDDAGD